MASEELRLRDIIEKLISYEVFTTQELLDVVSELIHGRSSIDGDSQSYNFDILAGLLSTDDVSVERLIEAFSNKMILERKRLIDAHKAGELPYAQDRIVMESGL